MVTTTSTAVAASLTRIAFGIAAPGTRVCGGTHCVTMAATR
jgi:hypothetical protein